MACLERSPRATLTPEDLELGMLRRVPPGGYSEDGTPDPGVGDSLSARRTTHDDLRVSVCMPQRYGRNRSEASPAARREQIFFHRRA